MKIHQKMVYLSIVKKYLYSHKDANSENWYNKKYAINKQARFGRKGISNILSVILR